MPRGVVKRVKHNAGSLKVGPICRTETSVNSYQSTPRNIPEEWRSEICLIRAKYEYTFHTFVNIHTHMVTTSDTALRNVICGLKCGPAVSLSLVDKQHKRSWLTSQRRLQWNIPNPVPAKISVLKYSLTANGDIFRRQQNGPTTL
jgi:hypothetical protein